jgi:hypothetical protein
LSPNAAITQASVGAKVYLAGMRTAGDADARAAADRGPLLSLTLHYLRSAGAAVSARQTAHEMTAWVRGVFTT